MTNTVIGHINSPWEPTTKSEGCWDSDTFGNLGFTKIQVKGATLDVNHENQDQGVLFVETGWKVQGVCGTNPLKVKNKIKTTYKVSDSNYLTVIKVDEKLAFVKNGIKTWIQKECKDRNQEI